ncbi:IS30 family transposase [Sulfuriferula sp.]|uniref:IS30 family transposase n=1 Tax=Sulfuriferula sp. TaxID=2025307 RepID=UPI00272FF558|nr:IS30 family transposase [Sulfuriferula sp.]MDP2025815.1 IS30 family transposase [Sulfuriferula sp.]
MKYTHLTQDERYQIAILAKAGHDKSEIARLMERHKSTISREMTRNRGARGYRPKQAHALSQSRIRAAQNSPRVAAATWAIVDVKLAETWSPEQISGHLKVNRQATVSHEAFYQHIYADKRAGGTLHRTLRCQKARRKRYGGRERRGTIPNQVSIDLRPAVVAERGRFGDWEGDLVIGAGQKQTLVTLNERTSRYTLIAHVPKKTAQAVSDAMVSLLTPFAACVHTLTTDNGKEFAQHERIAQQLGADFFFAHPYASWERGANENMNGLIRQFFPKKMAFESITLSDIELAMHRLNHRPRKCLGFKTPHEVFMKQLHSRHNAVALQT